MRNVLEHFFQISFFYTRTVFEITEKQSISLHGCNEILLQVEGFLGLKTLGAACRFIPSCRWTQAMHLGPEILLVLQLVKKNAPGQGSDVINHYRGAALMHRQGRPVLPHQSLLPQLVLVKWPSGTSVRPVFHDLSVSARENILSRQ